MYAPIDPIGKVVFDSLGNMYIADPLCIYKVDTNGIITLFAGTPSADQSGGPGDGGPAIDARFRNISSIAIDNLNNIYIADSADNCIRKIDACGIINKIVGIGGESFPRFGGDGGLAIDARISVPSDLEVDSAGNIYFVDSNNNRIRKVDTSGIIATIAGNGEWSYSGDGGPAINAGMEPFKLALDSTGNIYFSDWDDHIRRIDVISGIITRFAGNEDFSDIGGITIDKVGNIYIAELYNNLIRRVKNPPAEQVALG